MFTLSQYGICDYLKKKSLLKNLPNLVWKNNLKYVDKILHSLLDRLNNQVF